MEDLERVFPQGQEIQQECAESLKEIFEAKLELQAEQEELALLEKQKTDLVAHQEMCNNRLTRARSLYAEATSLIPPHLVKVEASIKACRDNPTLYHPYYWLTVELLSHYLQVRLEDFRREVDNAAHALSTVQTNLMEVEGKIEQIKMVYNSDSNSNSD